ncbi:MAG: zf-TFIIB domain-containing protein [Chloroflexota bacterium]|nr:zf-TFIIB domain-containing protein [Chloroflexota bacterium]
MQCPIDQTELTMTDRQGVEIDYCPKCRGVWLDRGELDKIIERSAELNLTRAAAQPTRVATAAPVQGNAYDRDRDSYRDRDDDDDEYTIDKNGRRKKKRGSFLDDLFDF